MHVLQMCSNATSNGPARCALAMQAQRKAKNSLISKLCSSATTDVPAQCALTASHMAEAAAWMSRLSASANSQRCALPLLRSCRVPKDRLWAQSRPTDSSASAHCCAVLSQYGKIITDQDAADVGLEMPRLVITVRAGERPARISLEAKSCPKSAAHTPLTKSASIRVPGVLWLKLSLPDSESRAGLWPLYVSGTIARDDCAGGGEASGCDTLYSMFVSVKGDGDDGKRCGQEHFCATLSGWKPVMLALACRGVLIDEALLSKNHTC